MNDARHRGARAAPHIGGGPRDYARRRHATEQGRADVGDALPHEFLIGVVAVVNHAVSDHRAEQRFNRAEDGDGEAGVEQVAPFVERQAGPVRQRKTERNAAELGADRLNAEVFEVKQIHCRRAERDGRDGTRHAAAPRFGPGEDEQHTRDGDGQRQSIRLEVSRERFDLADEVRRQFHVESEKVVDLRAEDDDRNAAGEAGDDGVRDVFDQPAQAGHAHHDEDESGDQRSDDESFQSVRGDDRGQQRHERSGRSADLYQRAAERRNKNPSDHRSKNSNLRLQPRGNRQRHRQRQGDEADRGTGREVGKQILAGIVFQCVHQSRTETNAKRHLHRIIFTSARSWRVAVMLGKVRNIAIPFLLRGRVRRFRYLSMLWWRGAAHLERGELQNHHASGGHAAKWVNAHAIGRPGRRFTIVETSRALAGWISVS